MEKRLQPTSAVVESSHAFLDHRGELQLQVRGRSLADILTESARALASLQLHDGPRGPAGPWRETEVRSPDPEALLVDWLNDLIFEAESRCEVATEVEVLAATPTHLQARVRGVAVDQPPALVKAATLHDIRVRDGPGGWEANVILDI